MATLLAFRAVPEPFTVNGHVRQTANGIRRLPGKQVDSENGGMTGVGACEYVECEVTHVTGGVMVITDPVRMTNKNVLESMIPHMCFPNVDSAWVTYHIW